ncbi:MAG TPA: TadE/TadG family type IV pilus assembly protein [Phenylobacterium sp.]|nr:TadE/TadG family type IV pilus assembly protein [Phenylobacterium sp.]
MRTAPPSRLSRFASRFARAERGATAVEFGLVSLPILMMIFGLLEIAMVFLVGTTLDQATQAAARQIRTGEFQTSATPTKAAFKALVCQRMTWLQPKCNADLWLDVQTYSDFATLAATPPMNAPAFDPNTTCFSTGQPTDIVLVRAYFEWDLITPLLSVALQNMGGGSGKRLISSTTAFRNEPYNDNPPVGTKCN